MSSNKRPWPTKDAMQQIYEQHFWGGKDYDFYSGEGSHQPEIIKPYFEVVSGFLKSHKNKLTVCDLGCGDFNIGKHLFEYTQKYIAVDIVESLILRNIEIFKANNLEFHCLDISKDELPKADCIILKQVLQHLSNEEIKSIVKKLSNYKYMILTEHLPMGNFTPNKNKIASQGIRLKQNSGVDLLAEPFNLKVKSTTVLDEFILNQNKGKIVTTIIELH
ncbi:methyltransferase [Winogradskyella sp. A2]|uniref:methyltransferase n=1 Tax=Winogradskyella sp. A2 TaxID=3366944 RepID=UPI00398C47FF